MRLISFETQSIHNHFNNVQISFSPDEGFSDVYRSYYPESNYSLFIGENGSGKTMLLSSIAKFFYYLRYHHERIRSGTSIEYSTLMDGGVVRVKLKREGKGVSVSLNGNYSFTLEVWPIDFAKYKGRDYDNFFPYLPKLILSAFSIHGEYLKPDPLRNPGFFYSDVSTIYHRFAVQPIKDLDAPLIRGLKKLVGLLHREDQPKLSELLNMLELTYLKEVRVGQVDRQSSAEFSNGFAWMPVNEKILDKSYYIVDIAFERDGKRVTLQSMGSGERILWERLLCIMADIDHNSIVIIEEPELHLNPSWIKQFITIIELLFGEYEAHFLIATHSFSIINQLFQENIHVVRNGMVTQPKFTTFMANEVEIKYNLFPHYKLASALEIKVSDRIERARSIEELEQMLLYLGDSYARFLIYKRIQTFKGRD